MATGETKIRARRKVAVAFNSKYYSVVFLFFQLHWSIVVSRSREGQGPIQSPSGMARLLARTLQEETEDRNAIYNPK